MDNYFWLLIHLFALCTISVSGKVFVSIDCGAKGSFTDENLIVWKGDDDLISNGVTHVVQSNYSVSRVADTLRVFTTRKKNCYSIEVEEGEKVLVRAGFNYGNYDNKSNPPIFDLHFDGNYWVTVNSSEWVFYETIYVVKKKVISVCVAQTMANQFPFISYLEVRGLDSQMYNKIGPNYALLNNARFGFAMTENIRFPADPYDRIWAPQAPGAGLLNVSNDKTIINVDVPDEPPQAVLKNAIAPPYSNQSIILSLGTMWYPIRYPVYINWYFSDVQERNSTQSRVFRVLKDNVPFSLPIVPIFGNVTEYYISNITVNLNTIFTLDPIATFTTLPPLINAVELFSISDPLTDGTNGNDVEGLASLQNAFAVLQEWSGDPCLPAPHSWEWIECNNDPAPRVTTINLSSFNLSGSLPDFSKMDALQIIDLHNNSLTGRIPNFLGNLPNLKQLNLADNQFSGSIPKSISKNSQLNLTDTGNAFLCIKGKSCPSNGKNTNKLPIILGITIPVLLILCAIVSVLIVRHRRKADVSQQHSGNTSRRSNGLSSVVRGTTATDNFDHKGANDKERFYRSPSPLLADG
ncbi:uncharacterized protein At1g24485-like [Rutidosis leptorrhynchoides]|uniref:uncharacterized protein At1g24485-like n=1 Tax=Rutidosis leptorrhynchoides TaxID=125765 RepID=UPI003A9A5377